jgi:hypothetical protein
MPEDRKMPNDALRLFFLAIEEVMGKEGMRAVLRGAKLEKYMDNYPPKNLELGVSMAEYGAAEQAVEDFYGPRGARAMLLRVGRALFNYGMKEQSAVLGLAGQALKLMPVPMTAKMKLLLEQMAAAGNKTVNQPVYLEEDAEAFYLVYPACMCEYRPKHSNAYLLHHPRHPLRSDEVAHRKEFQHPGNHLPKSWRTRVSVQDSQNT